jgi:hypothetical protein
MEETGLIASVDSEGGGMCALMQEYEMKGK